MALVDFAFELLRLSFAIACHYAESLYRLVVAVTPKDVRGQVALVTGGAGGIGRELARQLARDGAKVVIWDIDEDGAKETAALIRSADGGEAYGYLCDITRTSDVSSAAKLVRRDVGEVDILVNNAGVAFCRPVIELSEAEIRQTFEVNTLAHFWTVKEFLPGMLERRRGHIVTISSMAAKGGSSLNTDYCASKWAVFGFAESIRAELRAQGQTDIFCTIVCPFFVNTDMLRRIADRASVEDRFGRILEPEEVAEVVVRDMRANRRYSYIPRAGGWAAIQDFMPVKTKDAIEDFVRVGLFTKKTD